MARPNVENGNEVTRLNSGMRSIALTTSLHSTSRPQQTQRMVGTWRWKYLWQPCSYLQLPPKESCLPEAGVVFGPTSGRTSLAGLVWLDRCVVKKVGSYETLIAACVARAIGGYLRSTLWLMRSARRKRVVLASPSANLAWIICTLLRSSQAD